MGAAPSNVRHLLTASAAGTVDEVQQCLDAAAEDVGKIACDAAGRTPLFLAASGGHTEALGLLLKSSMFNANARTVASETTLPGETPLHAAAGGGYAACIELLISHGADPDSASDRGIVPLYMSAFKGHEGCVRALIEGRADISRQRDDGTSALHIACKGGHAACVAVLLQSSACATQLMRGATSPLYLSCAYAHTACVKCLVTREPPSDSSVEELDWQTESGRTALFAACDARCSEAVKALHELVAKTYIAENGGCYPLHAACNAGSADIARILLEYGARADLLYRGRTAEECARLHGHLEAARVLQAHMEKEGGGAKMPVIGVQKMTSTRTR